MADKYIILQDSNMTKTKRFICVFPGYNPFKERKDTIESTVDGELDIQRGAIYKTFSYNFRVRIEEDDANYGDQADLEYFYDLNEPNGSPSDKITLTDHYGGQWIVVMTGNYDPQVQTVYLDGPYAWALIPVTLRVINHIEDSGS
jgi:hypothetical protein